MTGIERAGVALAVLLSCACTETPPATQQQNAIATEAAPALQSFCAEFREEEERARDDEPVGRGWPTALPGMAPLDRRPAPAALTAALLGPPCGGGDDLWAVPVARLIGHVVNLEQEFVAVRAPSLVTLGDGRTAFFAIASEGKYHAADAFGLIAIVDEADPSRTPLFAMPGGGTWGEAGGFNAPSGQRAIWSAAGDVSFGDAEGWAGVTDVSGAAPRALGRFLTFGRHTCLSSDADIGSQCRGAWEYVVTSIAYAPGGEVTLTWRLESFDARHSGDLFRPQRLRTTTRSLSATYRVEGGSYRRVSGEEPPRI
jgi:hypothetical protein